MITKFVLIIWLGFGQNEILSIQTFNKEVECQSVAQVLEQTMERRGWFKCVPYRFTE